MTTRRHRLDDVAQLPRRLRYPHGGAGSVTWHWQAVGVVVRVCREGCGWLVVVVVAVGESGEAAGPVGVDGGGGWNGTVVGCLLIVDDNKSSVGVCRRSLWV